MSLTVGELNAKLSLDMSGFTNGLKQADTALKSLAQQASRLKFDIPPSVTKSFSGVTASTTQLKQALGNAIPVSAQLKQRLQEQQTQLGVLGTKLAEVTAKYGEGSSKTAALAAQMQKLDNQINTTKSALANVAQEEKNVAEEATKATPKVSGLSSVFANMVSTAGGILLAQTVNAVSNALTGAFTTAMDFEHALSAVSAVAGGLSADQLEQLKQKALEVGANTSLSASQAVSAMEMLVKNGIDPTLPSFNAIVDSTVALTEATGTDMSNAADIATDAMANFGLSADQVKDAVDGISGVTVASKFTIDDYRLAMAQAGGAAGSMGVSLDDFNVVIAGTSSLFASGSDAGTAFKTLLLSLSGNSNAAKVAMQELGIITADGANQFFTASGELRNMSEVSQVLSTAMAGLTQEQQMSYLKTIFGVDAYRMAVGMMNLAGTSADGAGTKFEELANKIAQVDAAEQAKERLNNFSGALEQVKGAAETLAIIGMQPLLDTLTPLMLLLAQGIGSFATFANSILSAENPLQMLLSTINKVIPGFQDLANDAISWGSNIVNQFTAGIMSSMAPLISTLQYIGSVIRYWLQPGSPPKIVPDLDSWGTEAATVYYDGWSKGDYSALQDMGNTIQSTLKGMIDAGLSSVPEEGIIPLVLGARSAIGDAISQFNELGYVSEEALQKIITSAGDAGSQIEPLVRSFFDLEMATAAVAAAQEELNAVTEEYAAKLSPLNEQMQAINDQQNAIKDQEKLAKLNKTIADEKSTDAEKELARLEIQKMALQDQIDATEEERDVAVDSAKEKVNAAKEQEAQAKAALDAQKAQIDATNNQNKLIADQIKLLERLAEEAANAAKAAAGGGGGGGGGGMGGGISLPERSFTAPEANAKTDPVSSMMQSAGKQFTALQAAAAPIITFIQSNMTMIKASLAGVGAVIAYALGPILLSAIHGLAVAFTGMIVAAAPIVTTFALVAGAGMLIYGAWTGTLGEILATVTNTFGGIIGYVQGQLPVWIGVLSGWITAAWSWVAEVTPIVLEKISYLITTLVTYVGTMFPIWMQTLGQWAIMLGQWILDALPVASQNLMNLISTLVGYVASNLPSWIATLLEWATAAVRWVGEAIPPLLVNLSQFLGAILQWGYSTALPAMIAWGADAALKMIMWVATELIPKVVPQFALFLAEILIALGQVTAGIMDSALNLGKAIIDGMIQGIMNGMQRVIQAAQEMAARVYEAAMNALDAHSPSKKFIEVGYTTPQGMALGIEKGMPLVQAAAMELGNSSINATGMGMMSTAATAPMTTNNTGSSYVINLDLSGSTLSRGEVETILDTRLQKIVTTAQRLRKS